MSAEEKNLKDISNNSSLALKDSQLFISYTKTNKLVTALYMVTDIMDTDEPLRTKLRKLGAEIVSDIQYLRAQGFSYKGQKVMSDITEILSFLTITSTLGMISEMNSSILKNEFGALQNSIRESFQNYKPFGGAPTLSDFFLNAKVDEPVDNTLKKDNPSFVVREAFISKGHSIGHTKPTRIGVQKGSTLMQALSDKMSVIKKDNPVRFALNRNGNFLLKGQRQEEIISIIKDMTGGATITDIKEKAKVKTKSVLKECGEKTLQRELISMVEGKVLKKTGTKRWSRYFIA